MSWRLRVRHSTGYRYASSVVASYNEVRLTPLRVNHQLVLDNAVDVSPRARPFVYTDYWGTQVTAFDVHEAHTQLEVTSTSVVDTFAPVAPPAPEMTWGDLLADRIHDTHVEFLSPTMLTTMAPAVTGQAADMVGGFGLADTVTALSDLVREHVKYTPGATGVKTSAQQAWELGEGVCQDIAHSTLGLLRSVGIPARYVSGYLAPKKDAEIGETAVGESHAWVEAWIGGWWGWDPTNGVGIGERHVVVARGRDYGDVPPLKGVYAGGASEALGVTVEVTRLS